MDPHDYTPSEHFTPVKGAYSPDYSPSEPITPVKHHYPTPPSNTRKTKIPPGNLRVNTQIAMSEEMQGKSPQRTIWKSKGSLSVQDRRVLKAHDDIIADAQNNPELDLIDYGQIWKTHVKSVSQAELIVATNPFYDEYTDGNYYAWLNDTYYEGDMPEIVRRANAFRGFPQLDDDIINPQGWEERHTYYQSPEGIREMEPYQVFIEREMALLDPQLSEDDILAQEEATRESIEAFQKAWANTLGLSSEPTSTTLMESSAEASPATPSTSWRDPYMISSKTSAVPEAKTEPTSPSPVTTPISTAAKPGRVCAIRPKRTPEDKSTTKPTAGGSGKGSKKKRSRRHRHYDSAYKPGRDASGDDSEDDMPRKRHKKSRM